MHELSLKCDILIIGGGPAGLCASLLLSKKGYSIILIEKNTKCGSLETKFEITEGKKISYILDEIGIKPNKKSYKSEWSSNNHCYIHDSYGEDYYFKRGPDKDSLEYTLLKKIGKNVKILTSSTVYSIDNTGLISVVKISTLDGRKTIIPKYIIISDGSGTEWRRNLRLKTQIFSKFIGVGVVIETKENNIIPVEKIHFDKSLVPGGHFFSGSVGKDIFFCAVADINKISEENLNKNLDQFIDKNFNLDYKIKNRYAETGISGIQETVVRNILFIGGSAHFYDPLLGYGLNYAIESAYYAAKAIDENNLEIYREYTNDIQEKIKNMYYINEIWKESEDSYFRNLIQSLSGGNIQNHEILNKIV